MAVCTALVTDGTTIGAAVGWTVGIDGVEILGGTGESRTDDIGGIIGVVSIE
jgi:hypothetical protein